MSPPNMWRGKGPCMRSSAKCGPRSHGTSPYTANDTHQSEARGTTWPAVYLAETLSLKQLPASTTAQAAFGGPVIRHATT